MAKGKPPTMSRRQLSLRGVAMVDTIRGQVRIRKWPRKRGAPKSAAQRFWIDWFKQANYLAKYASALDVTNAMDITRGTMLYPRDVLLKAMRGSLYWWRDENGKKWMPKYFNQEVSNSLDAIGQTAGEFLYRAADRWRALSAGNAGEVLTTLGPNDDPEWRAVGGGGGALTAIGTYIPTVNGVNQLLDIPIPAGYRQYHLVGHLNHAAAVQYTAQISRDDGASYLAAGYQFALTYKTAYGAGIGSSQSTAAAAWPLSAGNSTGAPLHVNAVLHGFAAADQQQSARLANDDAQAADGFIKIDSALFRADLGRITNLRIDAGSPYTAGEITLYGLT